MLVEVIYSSLSLNRDTLIELLGFKYKYYMSQPAVSVADGGGGGGGGGESGSASAVPDDLFKQTSLMIQHGILEMDAIYAMLGPDDKQIEEEAAKEVRFKQIILLLMDMMGLETSTLPYCRSHRPIQGDQSGR